jgi:hypothetical protein
MKVVEKDKGLLEEQIGYYGLQINSCRSCCRSSRICTGEEEQSNENSSVLTRASYSPLDMRKKRYF